MQVALENNIVFVVIEYLAILCWGLSGGLAAIRKGYDIFTIMLCGWLTALGGGLVRDVMLGALPPVGITDKGYVLTTLFSGIIVVVAHPEITKLKWTMTVIDALGLGLFAVSGTAKALAYGSSGMTAVFLGMFTALAGGLIRDIFIGDVPMIIRDKHLYAVPSFIGCILTEQVWRGVSYG
ncbi:trimeric intracellular cation channel family protein, partial [Bifidobacterium bifidum]|uniref:trimeric intracellular cation channel family protein n=1 Tax=Bifidobacterium bifidum TaxID=1681 RepID=UPI0012601237